MSSCSKFINNKEDVVDEAIDGLVMLNSDTLQRIPGTKIVVLKNPRQEQVSIICGGGSGHEPAHAGFVCEGMLTAAVCGGVFASPPHKEVLDAILSVPNSKGVLLVIKNYTGDILNFELAASLARSRGISVETVQIGEDITFSENKRGLAGTVLIYKILGAASNQGKSLKELKDLGDLLCKNCQTQGVSLSSCSLPGNKPTFTIDEGEMEIGLGIHGEKGKSRQKIVNANELVIQMLSSFQFENTKNYDSGVIVLLNNLGSCTELEMNIIARQLLQSIKVKVARVVCGRIMTSLEMHGFSITTLPLTIMDNSDNKVDLSEMIDATVDVQHWKVLKHISQHIPNQQSVNNEDTKGKEEKQSYEDNWMRSLIQLIMEHLINKQTYLNELDAEVGDGDTGEGVGRSANEVLKQLKYLDFQNDLQSTISRIGEIIADEFGGTSGALYGVLLAQSSLYLNKNLNENTINNYSQALHHGLQQLQIVAQTQPGDRTMVDVLHAIDQQLTALNLNNQDKKSSKDIAQILYTTAKQASLDTAQLKAKKGRSRYLDGREIGKLDPGCELIVEWLSVIASNFN